MRKGLLIILLTFCINSAYAQVESEFEKFKKEQQKQMETMMQSDKALYDDLEKEYQDYLKAEKEAYDKFVKEMSAMWGGGNVVESTKKDWVEYSDDGKSRSVVDFEQGEATIEIIITPEEYSCRPFLYSLV